MALKFVSLLITLFTCASCVVVQDDLIEESEESPLGCVDLEYSLPEGYLEDEVECSAFYKEKDSGLFYYFSSVNPEDLNNYELKYQDYRLKVYEFVDYDLLEGHIFGEVNFRICDHLRSEYYLIEADSVVDENLELKIDTAHHMDLVDFVEVCSSLEV